jgi:hypothetical protein
MRVPDSLLVALLVLTLGSGAAVLLYLVMLVVS